MENYHNKLPVELSFNESYTGSNEDYKKLGEQYRLLSENVRDNLIGNIVAAMRDIRGTQSEYTVNRQLCHWFRTDIALGIAVAKGLDLDLSETIKQMLQIL